MLVLGIETSCDETSVAVVQDGRFILSQVITSSLRFHKKYGGIIPEIASRQHIEQIGFVMDNAIRQAGIKLKDINLIAVTEGPGLVNSLLVGISFAQALSFALKKPLVSIDHIQAHLYANFLEKPLDLPFIGLVISGGHTALFLVKNFNQVKLLGTTLDDACGEAFDKVAKILGLGYPGGVAIENLVKNKKFKRINFSCGKEVRGLDFSFSGIKTAVLYYVRSQKSKARNQILDIAASFQEAVVDTLIEKSFLACKRYRIHKLVVGGGVAANLRLRQRLAQLEKETDIKVYIPAKILCTDNAAMVAGLGYQLYVNRR
ncbi:MAG: tRNA (adenosine(37)-N6)-threonylcarbamoyltransferase complex transferase subunit TsaD [Candidatus Omnitrophica bacterium]|nr:tRNA (adenosine(37)-N6)-threonylcarbamoyltransferase complex transferase subunit TsaD [Candidatus Omnitrophota bacterium]